MKQAIIVLLLIVSSAGVAAQRYRESIGVAVGTLDGLTYKCYGKKSQHFVFQFDAFWQWGYMPEGGKCTYNIEGNANSYSEQTYFGEFDGSQYQAAMTSFSFMCQKEVRATEQGVWNWFIGGGFGVGMSWGYAMDSISAKFKTGGNFKPWLKVEEHLMTGVEYCFAKTPVSLGLEFRPGICENFQSKGFLYNRDEIYLYSFDWAVNMTVRYCFGEVKVK